ncbi:MAG: sugar transferase [Acidobacteria bacterium]|nr:MAG: sugar transferase [Acidobacteriota bacterium]
MRRLRTSIERLVEAGCAASGLLLLTPVLAALALWILWDDGPPLFFSQKRVGRRGKLFSIWKFRTMRAGAPGRGITASGDRRVTRVGAWLRKFKLDELPQLYNVLKGDMSLIGPRPEVPEYVQLESPLWQAVLQVRPGITDLATLLHRDEEEVLGASADPNAFYRESVLPAKLRLNLAYLRARSFWRDVNLIFLTLRYSFFPGKFDRNHVKKILGMGATIHDAAEYLHPLSQAVDRQRGDQGS